jgi:hypothetical protein
LNDMDSGVILRDGDSYIVLLIHRFLLVGGGVCVVIFDKSKRLNSFVS